MARLARVIRFIILAQVLVLIQVSLNFMFKGHMTTWKLLKHSMEFTGHMTTWDIATKDTGVTDTKIKDYC